MACMFHNYIHVYKLWKIHDLFCCYYYCEWWCLRSHIMIMIYSRHTWGFQLISCAIRHSTVGLSAHLCLPISKEHLMPSCPTRTRWCPLDSLCCFITRLTLIYDISILSGVYKPTNISLGLLRARVCTSLKFTRRRQSSSPWKPPFSFWPSLDLQVGIQSADTTIHSCWPTIYSFHSMFTKFHEFPCLL